MAQRKRTEQQESRRFGVILAVILAAAGGLSLWRGHAGRGAVVEGLAALALALPFVAPALWLRAFRLWMKFAELLSWVMTRVILTVFFFLILTPIGLLMRLFGKAPLDLRFRDDKPTYWIDRPEAETPREQYERLY